MQGFRETRKGNECRQTQDTSAHAHVCMQAHTHACEQMGGQMGGQMDGQMDGRAGMYTGTPAPGKRVGEAAGEGDSGVRKRSAAVKPVPRRNKKRHSCIEQARVNV